MFRRHLRPLLLASLAALLTACVIVVGEHDGRTLHGSGQVVSEARDAAPFHAIEIDTVADVVVHVGPRAAGEAALVVHADDNLLPHVTTEVRDGVLHIGLAWDGSFRGRIEVHARTPELTSCSVDGVGDVVVEGLSGDSFRADLDGAGTIRAQGAVRVVHAEIDGAGSLELGDLEAREASVSIDGAGNVSVTATERLSYSIDGAGQITYGGAPVVTGDVDGAGSARAR